jgi:hypothetical protein
MPPSGVGIMVRDVHRKEEKAKPRRLPLRPTKGSEILSCVRSRAFAQ